ncbi:MAG: carbohydrate porin [Halioglobus sp.]
MTHRILKIFVFFILCPLSLASPANQDSEHIVTEEPELVEERVSGNRRESTLFGSRDSISVQLETDEAIKSPSGRLGALDGALSGIQSWKRGLLEDYGLQLGMDLATLSQWASESIDGTDNAWGAVARLYGRWAFHNRAADNTGFIGFKVENRSALGGEIPPKNLRREIGYLGYTDIVFSDDGNLITELSYQQRLGDNDQAAIVVGRFDPNNYMDVLGCCSPWTTFSNLSHLLNLSISLPDASWGVGAGSWLGESEQWYVSGSISDANGTLRSGLDWFTGGAEFFKQAEIGWSPSRERRLYTKTSFTVWHVDEREDAGLPSSHGVAFSANKTWKDTWMGFFKAGVSSGEAVLYDEFALVGFGRVFHSNTDRIGLAMSYGKPPDSSLDAEKTMEVFYKFQLAKSLQLTTSYQHIMDPALNPDESSIDMLGVRLRFIL